MSLRKSYPSDCAGNAVFYDSRNRINSALNALEID